MCVVAWLFSPKWKFWFNIRVDLYTSLVLLKHFKVFLLRIMMKWRPPKISQKRMGNWGSITNKGSTNSDHCVSHSWGFLMPNACFSILDGCRSKMGRKGKSLPVHHVCWSTAKRVRSTEAIIKERREKEGSFSFNFLPGYTLFTSDHGMKQIPYSQEGEIARHAN